MSLLLQSPPETSESREIVAGFHSSMERIREQVRQIIVGQDEVVENLLMTLLVGGHCLITGMPGTAKTLLVRTLATALGLTFKRIQFTPDLMPTDVTGTDIIEEDPTTGRRTWTFVKGPIFTNVMLADEVNRTPPKTQAALLEAMQELSVTVRGNTYQLEPPFLVLATQNPIELEGTYPLPEAQLDRFLFNVILGYLSAEEECDVVDRNTAGEPLPEVQAVTCAEDIRKYQWLVRQVAVSQAMIGVRRRVDPRHPSGRPGRAGDRPQVHQLRGQRPRNAVSGSRRKGPRPAPGAVPRYRRRFAVPRAADPPPPRADQFSCRVRQGGCRRCLARDGRFQSGAQRDMSA